MVLPSKKSTMVLLYNGTLLYAVGLSEPTWFIIVIDFHWHWSRLAHNILPHGVESHTGHTLTGNLWKRQETRGFYTNSLIRPPDKTPGVI